MSNVTATYKLNTTSSQAAPAGPGTSTPLSRSLSLSASFSASGTNSDQVNLKYTNTIALNAANTTLDLTALTDDYGGAVNFKRVKSIFIKNKAATDGMNLTVAPGASNGWNSAFVGAMTVCPSTNASNDGAFLMTAPSTTGYAVSNTVKNLTLNPAANAFSVDIEIMGCDA
jgi:hypothetical protein